MTDLIGKLSNANWGQAPFGATHVSLNGLTFYRCKLNYDAWYCNTTKQWNPMLSQSDLFHASLISKVADLNQS